MTPSMHSQPDTMPNPALLPAAVIARACSAPGPCRIGLVPVTPARLREVRAAVPKSACWALSDERRVLQIWWSVPGRRGMLSLHSLGVTWISRHGSVADCLGRHGAKRLSDCFRHGDEYARATLCKRLGRAWKYVTGWTLDDVWAHLAAAEASDLADLVDVTDGA